MTEDAAPTIAPPRRRCAARRQQRRGFTMVEAALSVVIVAGMMLASIATVGAVGRIRKVQAERQQAVAMAHALLTEILQSYYQDPGNTAGTLGPPVGATRSTFNGVEDYAGYSETPPATRTGVLLAGDAGWTRAVSVHWVSTADGATVSSAETGLKSITVTVTSPTGKTVSLTGLRSKYDPYEQTPFQAVNYTLWAGLDLQVGPNGRTIHAAAHPMNLTPGQ